MCGIAAICGPDAGPRALRLMAGVAHRGPDGTGLWSSDGIALAHTRLAVMDPTPRSDQPLRRGPHRLIYNGEIYNFAQLRRELEDAGERFVTTGDTEVVLAALARWGTGALERLDGMFALVLHDERDGSLLAARDRHGIKPLYWRANGAGIDLCSEMKPLIEDRSLATVGSLQEFLRFGAPITRPWNPDVAELPPGTWLRWTGTVRQAPFAPTAGSTAIRVDSRPSGHAEPALVLRDEIISHARADRPVAVFLSGGFDSTVVLAGLKEAGRQPMALTLDTGANHDDLQRARRSARHYGVDHDIVPVVGQRLGEQFTGFLEAMDQPGIDGFNTYLISEACRERGYPVALSGLGADELFGGYRYYSLDARLRALLPVLRRLPLVASGRLNGLMASRLHTSSARVGELLASRTVADRHGAFRSLFSSSEVAELTGGRFHRSHRWSVTHGHAPERQLAELDASTYLRPTLLRDADVNSMRHGVELRVPFVTTALRAAALQSDRPLTKAELATAWGDPYLVRMAAEPKLTFRLPWNEWLRQTYADAAPVLAGSDPWRGLVDRHAARAALAAEVGSTGGEPLRGWALLLLARWLAIGDGAEQRAIA